MLSRFMLALALFVGCTSAQPDDAGSDTSAPPPDNRCFIVYVHGRDDHDLSPGIATDADRLAYWQGTPGDLRTDFVYASSNHGACLTLVTGYNGRNAYYNEAEPVASQIVSFIQDNNVPDSRLILIGHSMGGLVIRTILNLASGGGDFAYVSQKTHYAITIATPHLGSPGADAQQGMSTACANTLAALLNLTGVAPNDLASMSLTTQFLQAASSPGGPMHDSDRTRMIYTVGTTGWNNGLDAAITSLDGWTAGSRMELHGPRRLRWLHTYAWGRPCDARKRNWAVRQQRFCWWLLMDVRHIHRRPDPSMAHCQPEPQPRSLE